MTTGGIVRRRASADRGGRRARAARRAATPSTRRVAAMLTSWVGRAAADRARAPAATCSSPGAGERADAAGLLRRGARARRRPATRGELVPVDVVLRRRVRSSTSARRRAACPATRPGVARRRERWGTHAAGRARRARGARWRATACRSTRQQAYVFEILAAILVSDARGARAVRARRAASLREGDRFARRELADTIERLGAEGAAPFYTRRHRRARSSTGSARAAALLTARRPRRLRGRSRASRCARRYRGRDVLTNPPPSAGGMLLALALARLDARRGPPAIARRSSRSMEAAQAQRTPEFVDGPRPSRASPSASSPSRLGSTTHISVLDGDGRACAVTCTNGEGSGVVVPGTGIHLNNIMGEEDLNPLGSSTTRAGPADAVDDGADGRARRRTAAVELVLGSAGSNRIRSAILQTIVGVVDHGMRRAGRRRRAARALRGRRRLRRAGRSTLDALDAPGHEIAPLPRPQPLLRRRAGGRARPARPARCRARRPAPRRRRGRRVRRRARRASPAVAAVARCALAGCGGRGRRPVRRRAQRARSRARGCTLLVTDDGRVRCNRGGAARDHQRRS